MNDRYFFSGIYGRQKFLGLHHIGTTYCYCSKTRTKGPKNTTRDRKKESHKEMKKIQVKETEHRCCMFKKFWPNLYRNIL